MRRALFLVPFVVAASCGGVIDASDGGSDGSASCGSCPQNQTCQFPISEGCGAKAICMPQVACKGLPSCACDGTMVSTCGQGATKPIAHGGPCAIVDEGGPPVCPVQCELCDMTGFTALPQSKPLEATNACSAEDITSFVKACLDPTATQQTCAAWEQGDAGKSACGACVLTQIGSATWGPIVCDTNECTINTGGCIDILSGQVPIENGTNGSCGDLTTAADQCLSYACGTCTTPSDSNACTQDAEQGGCKSYVDAEQTASVCALTDGGATACSPQTDSDWASFINVFCGTGP
jgi:hypothetical protein